MRKNEIYVVTDPDSRDFDKKFVITEMSAWEGEILSQDLLRKLSRGQEIPDDIVSMGCHGLATLGMTALLLCSEEESVALTKRLLNNVKICIAGNDGNEAERRVIPSDFEEWKTIQELKDRIFKLNFDFLKKDPQ